FTLFISTLITLPCFYRLCFVFFFFQAEDGIRDRNVTGVQTCALPIYFASCDADKLMPGPYVVSVANYSRAEGRRATVQLASWKEGVLGTRSVNLGGATGSSPAYDMFVLNVSKDEETGQYSIALVD